MGLRLPPYVQELRQRVADSKKKTRQISTSINSFEVHLRNGIKINGYGYTFPELKRQHLMEEIDKINKQIGGLKQTLEDLKDTIEEGKVVTRPRSSYFD